MPFIQKLLEALLEVFKRVVKKPQSRCTQAGREKPSHQLQRVTANEGQVAVSCLPCASSVVVSSTIGPLHGRAGLHKVQALLPHLNPRTRLGTAVDANVEENGRSPDAHLGPRSAPKIFNKGFLNKYLTVKKMDYEGISFINHFFTVKDLFKKTLVKNFSGPTSICIFGRQSPQHVREIWTRITNGAGLGSARPCCE